MLDEKLLKDLVCPKCKGKLLYDRENDFLICPTCKLKYPVEDEIPIMMIDQAEKL